MKFSRIDIPASHVISLTWQGDELVDWVNGGARYFLDGRSERPYILWAYLFDAAVATQDNEFVVIYTRTGTKALLLRNGKLLRELNRSFYHAHVYEYPICVWKTPEGRALIAHCPEDYCRIDIEDAESGEILTKGVRSPEDFFHSRLMVNPNGTRLLSAGWFWHPLDAVVFFEVEDALTNPASLDKCSHEAPSTVGLAGESFACWQTNDCALIGSSNDPQEPERVENFSGRGLMPGGVAVYDVVHRSYISTVQIGETSGPMMPLGKSHAVCFYGHPKIVSLESGEIVKRWEDIDSGKQISSIIDDLKIPPMALDPERMRFAVAGPAEISVVQIEL